MAGLPCIAAETRAKLYDAAPAQKATLDKVTRQLATALNKLETRLLPWVESVLKLKPTHKTLLAIQKEAQACLSDAKSHLIFMQDAQRCIQDTVERAKAGSRGTSATLVAPGSPAPTRTDGAALTLEG
jgi:hypothetical protein